MKEHVNKESPENNVNDYEDDFIPSGVLSQSPLVPVLGSSPFFGYTSG